jgi:colanic acid biosynthesis glycosyl transferase WcaI
LKILIVTQYFWPENFPINDLSKGLLEKGHQVTVATGIPNYPEGRFFSGYGLFKNVCQDYDGVKVLRVPLIPRGRGGGFRLALNFLSFALFASLLGPIMHRAKCDLIFVYEPSPITVGLPAIVLRAVKGVPVLFWVQDLWPESLSATGAVTSKWIIDRVETLVRFIYSKCDRILVQSEAFKPPIMSLGVERDRLTYFPNSAEGFYQPVTLEADVVELEKMPTGFRIMFAGNIGVAQDFPTILKTGVLLKEYTDIHFVILGDGRMYSWVKSQISALGLAGNFHLLGRYPAEKMPCFFSLADAMLVTLKKDPIFELTIPAKVQSYMACARPIIAGLDGEGARIVTEAGAGISCGAENPEKLAKAILTIYNSPENIRDKMGEDGRKYFEAHFERNHLLKKLDQLMRETERNTACRAF